LNDLIHNAAKDDKTGKISSYYIRAFTQYIIRSERFRHLYRPLGGFQSKYKYSIAEIRALAMKGAESAKACLPLIHIIVHNSTSGNSAAHISGKIKSINAAKMHLSKLSGLFKPKDEDDVISSETLNVRTVFSPSSTFRNYPISSKNFEKHWTVFHETAEFVAALYCIQNLRVDVRRKTTLENVLTSSRKLSTFDRVLGGRIERLPFGRTDFQLELVRRAEYFAKFLTARRKIDTAKRFPTTDKSLPSDLGIFSEAALTLDGHLKFQI
jgi:hypothetical protein